MAATHKYSSQNKANVTLGARNRKINRNEAKRYGTESSYKMETKVSTLLKLDTEN